MKQVFIINDGRKKKYGVKSISGYRKALLLKAFEKSLLENNYYNSLYFGFEIIMSGYFNEYWLIILSIMSENIHILSPELPFFINQKHEYFKDIQQKMKKKKIDIIHIRNLFKIQQDVILTIKNIVNSEKKHISYFIKQPYNNQQNNKIKPKGQLLILFKRFKQLLSTMINNKITYKGNNDIVLNDFFSTFGELLAIDCDSTHNIAYPYNINLYHHTRSSINKEIMTIFWNIVLKSSKFNKNVMTQIVSLYKIFNLKITNKLEKESYILLHVLFYIIYNYDELEMLRINKNDLLTTKRLYIIIQDAITNDEQRIDFLNIEDKNNKKKKKGIKKPKKKKIKKKKIKKITVIEKKKIENNKYSIVPMKTPIEEIIKINNKTNSKPITPQDIINNEVINTNENIPEDDDELLFYNLINEKEESDNEGVIDIVIQDGANAKENLYNRLMFNFDDLPTIVETTKNKTIINQNDNENNGKRLNFTKKMMKKMRNVPQLNINKI